MFDFIINFISNLLGKKKRQDQACLILTEDRQILYEKLPIVSSCLVDVKNQKAWHLLHPLLFMSNKFKRLLLLLDTRHAVPVSPYATLTEAQIKNLTNLDPIAGEALAAQLNEIEQESHTNQLATGFRFAITLMFIFVGILIILALTGKVAIPFFTSGG